MSVEVVWACPRCEFWNREDAEDPTYLCAACGRPYTACGHRVGDDVAAFVVAVLVIAATLAYLAAAYGR